MAIVRLAHAGGTDDAPCARIRAALAAGRTVALSFTTDAYAKRCGDDETCADWAEYRAAWMADHRDDVAPILVPTSRRRAVLADAGAVPAHATVFLRGEVAVAVAGPVVERDAYDQLARAVRGEAVAPAWRSSVTPLARSALRCR